MVNIRNIVLSLLFPKVCLTNPKLNKCHCVLILPTMYTFVYTSKICDFPEYWICVYLSENAAAPERLIPEREITQIHTSKD